MKNKNQTQDDSENEFDVDEPEEIQNNASDEEWTPEDTGRRTSSRIRSSAKKQKFKEWSSSEDISDDTEEDDEFSKKRKKTKKGWKPSPKKAKRITIKTEDSGEESENTATVTSTVTIGTKYDASLYQSGSFVVLRSDFDSEGDPPIWKIDGKALLQKYIPFVQEGKTLYKNTSVYSGWTINNKDQYYPVTVTFKQQNKKEHVVEFLKDLVKVEPEDAADDVENVEEEIE